MSLDEIILVYTVTRYYLKGKRVTQAQSYINRIVAAISSIEGFRDACASLDAHLDTSVAIPTLIRAPWIGVQFYRKPQTTLVIAETPDSAEALRNQLSVYVDPEKVLILPDRTDMPWREGAPAFEDIFARSRALWALEQGDKVIVVTSVRALMRAVVPKGSGVYEPLALEVGQERDLEHIARRLVEMGYSRQDAADQEGSFAWRGDTIDIHPPLGTSPVRIEFFGDEIETIRRFVPGSGQPIGSVQSVEIFPVREVSVRKYKDERVYKALEKAAFFDPEVAHHLDLLKHGISFNGIERYLPLLSEKTVAPTDYLSKNAVVVVAEPKALFDNASKHYAELGVLADKAGFKGYLQKGNPLAGLYLAPAQLDFGSVVRLTLVSIMRASTADVDVRARRPEVSGSDARLMAGVRSLLESGYSVTLALPNRRQRERVLELFVFEGIPVGDHARAVNIIDVDVVSGFVIPDARLAVIAATDAFPRSGQSKQKRRNVDPTKITFSFNPGDYVVHSSYGVALFKEIVRREAEGVERDYMHLQYAGGDSVFTPVEQIDKVTKYVGPDGGAPKVTRLGTKAWSRATSRARAAAKKLAFDLVNLYARRNHVKGFAFNGDTVWQAEMEALFPYEETPDQIEAIADVKADMESERPMDRLVCGDVGYGKTEVAIRAAFKAVQDNKQVMLLCPTTILAQQHYTSFSERFAPFDVRVEVMSRFRTPAQQAAALEGFVEGSVKVLIGTHRLLSRDIIPKDLGLLIIDEEQRFGVEHKEQLKNMREQIDVLAMSATPIPRTLQMSLSGVRDMSVIDTPPANRFPVKVHVSEWNADIVSHAIRLELERGGQVYYVSNRVKTIDDAIERVQAAAPEARVGVAHGQMSEKELENVMEQFAANEIDVLVATTIVESGIDNPHSNTLIIEDSQRLGLSQLYQLKGRVGRSHVHAYAYFLYPSSAELTPTAIERLMAIAEHDDLGSGIKIAMRDLEIRGAGSLIGGEQSGQLSAIGFDLFAAMISEAISEARGEVVTAFPDIRIGLEAPAFLPEEYIEEVSDRILIYRRLAAMTTSEAVAMLLAETVERFGELPGDAHTLFKLAKIKVQCGEIGATAVVHVSKYIQVSLPKLDEDVKESLTLIGALWDPRARVVRWKIPYGENVVDAASTLVGAILFNMS